MQPDNKEEVTETSLPKESAGDGEQLEDQANERGPSAENGPGEDNLQANEAATGDLAAESQEDQEAVSSDRAEAAASPEGRTPEVAQSGEGDVGSGEAPSGAAEAASGADSNSDEAAAKMKSACNEHGVMDSRTAGEGGEEGKGEGDRGAEPAQAAEQEEAGEEPEGKAAEPVTPHGEMGPGAGDAEGIAREEGGGGGEGGETSGKEEQGQQLGGNEETKGDAGVDAQEAGAVNLQQPANAESEADIGNAGAGAVDNASSSGKQEEQPTDGTRASDSGRQAPLPPSPPPAPPSPPEQQAPVQESSGVSPSKSPSKTRPAAVSTKKGSPGMMGTAVYPPSPSKFKCSAPLLTGTYRTAKGRIMSGEELSRDLERMANAYINKYLNVGPPMGGAATTAPGTKTQSKVLSPDDIEAVVSRLYQPKSGEQEIDLSGLQKVQLKYDDSGRETWVPAKKVDPNEQQEYMRGLYQRCMEGKKKTEEQLTEKYLKPLGKPRMHKA